MSELMPCDRHTSERSSRVCLSLGISSRMLFIYTRKFLNGLYQTIDTKKEGLKMLTFFLHVSICFKAEFLSILFLVCLFSLQYVKNLEIQQPHTTVGGNKSDLFIL